jgi:hypothetical protein
MARFRTLVPLKKDETRQEAQFLRCWAASVGCSQLPSDRPVRLTRFLFAQTDNLRAHVFFVRLGVDTQQAAIFFLQRVAVGE